MDDYLSKKFGVSHQDDENIIVEKVGEGLFSWMIDNTPKVNPDRILLEAKENGFCVFLHAPLSNFISLGWSKNLKLPQEAWTETSRSNGARALRVNYAKQKKGNSQEMAGCKKVQNNGRLARIDCNKAFLE